MRSREVDHEDHLRIGAGQGANLGPDARRDHTTVRLRHLVGHNYPVDVRQQVPEPLDHLVLSLRRQGRAVLDIQAVQFSLRAVRFLQQGLGVSRRDAVRAHDQPTHVHTAIA